ncbi:MAG: HRDC domain-containing protein [Fermentimonas sp.]|nr:HRDC domain-containing protein [Fermentimonas sp.]
MQFSNPYECAMDFAINTDRNIFITGKAGTGKTTFLRKFRDETTKQVAVVAPTGVAAINAGGTTIHSFFHLPFTPFTPTPAGRSSLFSRIKMNNTRRTVILELEVLVIDEISMVRADVLDAVDYVLRTIRHRHKEPFGGVQMIFIGDMYQLSPVAKTNEWNIISDYYKSVYFFHSHVMQEYPAVYIEFDKIFRQSDNQFIKVLNEVRNNSLSSEGITLLESRYNPEFNPPSKENYITLTTHNYSADNINRTELDKLKSPVIEINANIKGTFPENAFPVDEVLELKEGAKVMFVKNDTETPRRFYNGKIGIITSIDEDQITVDCPGDSDEISVSTLLWENIQYNTNKETNIIEEKIIGTFEQVPLRLAWAITIHKSQGLTFDRAIIDAGKAFSPGQVYVALSRCKSLEGMVLKSPVNRDSISVDEQVAQFSSSKPDEIFINRELELARKQFKSNLLLQLYDFSPICETARSWYFATKGEEPSFNEETIPFIAGIRKQLKEIDQVAEKFRVQLKGIVGKEKVDTEFLSDRLNSSSAYFVGELKKLIDTLKKSPATTDSKSNAKDYDESISSIFTAVALKKHLIKATAGNFSVETYYTARNRFSTPDFSVKSYSRGKTTVQLKSNHPDLLNELVQIRNYMSENENLPPYIVASTKTLVQMADYMPETDKDLLKIYGFGKKKLARFGAQFLEVINDYIAENGLQSEMIHFKEN